MNISDISVWADAGVGVCAIYLFARLRSSLDSLVASIERLDRRHEGLDLRVTKLEESWREAA